jgi:TonB-dependent SusC/RagA subfamily outer membrane receptor
MHLNIDSMPIVPLFLFKLSLSLAVVWCFYQLVLRRLTFHMLNRWYLLGYALLSFVFPFINIGPMLPDGPAGVPVVLEFIPAIGGGARGSVVAAAAHSGGPSVWTVVLWVLAAGSVLFAARVAVRWVSLIRLRRKARLIGGGAVKIYQVDGPVIPFSFGNAIYINQQLHTEKEWEDIILHEYVHIRQRHTVDILIAELVCIVNWYNPFAWLIRYSIRQNLEFIADQQVLDKGVDRKGYQYHLLKVMGEPRYRLANNFNFSSLKKRIAMMNKMRSARVHLLKLLFVLPLVAVLLVAFRDRGARLFGPRGPVYVNAAGIVITSPDRKPLEGVLVRDQTTSLDTRTDADGFYKLRIPVPNKSVLVHLEFTKPGYDTTFGEWNFPDVVKSIGILDVAVLHLPNKSGGNLFIAPVFLSVPSDPDYSDAKQEMFKVLKQSDDLNQFMKLKKDHPEIGLFFTTEDSRKEIVIYMDGTIERYGYPSTPGLAELYKKYGEIDEFMATDHPEGHQVNAGYLARWAAIGDQAQREFRTTNPNVRSVIFPGDSRVIVVLVSGKPKVYDMDNDAAVERAEFERLYGKLPDCVPKAGGNTDETDRKGGWPPRHVAPAKDTVPVGRKDIGRGQSVGAFKLYLDTARHQRPLFLVDGREVSQDTLNNLYPDQIESINVLKDSAALKKYGDKGKNGVILVVLKDQGSLNAVPRGSGDSITLSLPWKPDSRTVWIVDGKEEPLDSLRTLNPGRIKSISVLKDTTAVSLYGVRGRNGVVIVTLKQSLP